MDRPDPDGMRLASPRQEQQQELREAGLILSRVYASGLAPGQRPHSVRPQLRGRQGDIPPRPTDVGERQDLPPVPEDPMDSEDPRENGFGDKADRRRDVVRRVERADAAAALVVVGDPRWEPRPWRGCGEEGFGVRHDSEVDYGLREGVLGVSVDEGLVVNICKVS